MNNRNGFTLIELLAVIAIIAILTLMAVPALMKMYNENIIKSMHIQEKEISNAANMFIEDYCEDSIDGTNKCPDSYEKAVNNKKTVCLQDLQKKSDKYIDKVKYKGSDCKGYVTYYLDNETGIYGNEKTSLFCGLNDNGTYEYMTDSEYDLKEYCKCNADDDVCKYADEDVYCKFDGELKQGAEFVKGQYTYRYKQEGNYSSTTDLVWNNIGTDGWGVQLTDKLSTDPVTSKVCTYINNKPVISMSYMFLNSQATTLDLSSFDTKNVTNMGSMFQGSKAISIIGLDKFNTAKVTNMSSMFSILQATTLDLSSFNTKNVTNMSYMFANSKATNLDLSNFNTSNVINMRNMFAGSKATTLDLSSFDTSKVNNMNSMFYSSQATTLDLSSFNTSNVTNMSSMFYNLQATTLDLSSFDTKNVTNMSSMFSTLQATTLDLSSFDTKNVTNMRNMFAGSKATTLNLSSFNTAKVTDMGSMFYNSQATTLDLSSFNTSNVTNMKEMFAESRKLKTIFASNNFITDNVTSSTDMFQRVTNLVGGAGTKYNSSHVDKTYARIDASSTPGYFTLKNN